VQNVTDTFETTDSSVIRGALDSGGRVFAVPLHGFDGLVGKELQPDRRLGTEFSDHAKRHGAGGIFHTDELPAYGVTEEEVADLQKAVDAGPEDAVAIVAAGADVAEGAIEAVAERARVAIEGVPEETRGANEGGTTQYLRPLPGAARMYPETDVPPVSPDPSEVSEPELLTEKVERYTDEYGLNEDVAEQVAYGRRWRLFEEAIEMGVDANLAARTLESTVTKLRRDDVPTDRLTDDHFRGVFELVVADELTQEGVPELLAALAESPGSEPAELADELGLGSVGEDEVRETIVEIVERNEDQIEEQGMGAFSALMGECMGALRGKADGELVSDVLREEVQKRA